MLNFLVDLLSKECDAMNHSKRTSHHNEQLLSPDMAVPSNPAVGVSNAMMQERLLSQLQGIGKNPGQNVDKTFVIADGLAMTSNIEKFATSNVYIAMDRLVEKEGWTPEFAASWLGQAVVETGNTLNIKGLMGLVPSSPC